MALQKALLLLGICCGSAVLGQPHAKIAVTHGPAGEIHVAVNARLHRDYGLAYPMTYAFAVPGGTTQLTAYRKYAAAGDWQPIAEKTAMDFFNGVEAVRFSDTDQLAYVSVAFSAVTDSIYLKLTNHAGQNVRVEFTGLTRYYDNRAAVVTVTADDWHPYFDTPFQFALSQFRKYQLWVATGIVTAWCDSLTWRHIQTQLDSGYVEAMSHSRNHLRIPYADPVGEVTGSKEDIIANLELPALFRKGEREYVYVWVAPYGEYDERIDDLVSENQYLVSRLVHFDERGFATWESDKRKYAPIGVTREMGPLWGGSNNLTDLNRAFDTAVAAGGIYHVMCHPHVLFEGEWSKPYTLQHLQYISQRKDIWYVSMGHLYLYHLLEDETAIPAAVAAATQPLPAALQLSQNYPNPFNPHSRIDFRLAQTGGASLRIYNLAGQLVQTVFENSEAPAGAYSLTVDLRRHPSGVYYYILAQGRQRLIRRMTLIQ